MGILSTIFGSGEVIKQGMDLIDDMHTSGEEEIQAKTKSKVDILKAYAPFKIAQRYLMLMFSTTYIFSFILVLILTLAGKVDSVDDVKNVLAQFYVGEIMLTIIIFYFGGGFIEGAIKARK